MDLWDWIEQYRDDCTARGDEERLEMTFTRNRAYAFRETDPARAVAMLRQGRADAERLGESWWVLILDYYIAEALMFFVKDYRNVLDLAVRNVLEIRKPAYNGFPDRAKVYNGLLDAYLGIDPLGYEEQIREAMGFMEQEAGPEQNETRYLLLSSRRSFASARAAYDEAYALAHEALALADTDQDAHTARHHLTFITCDLCWILWHLGRWTEIADMALYAEEVSRGAGNQRELSEALAWQAVAAAHQGDAAAAQRLYRLATSRSQRLRMLGGMQYYDALHLYHEKMDNFADALRLRERELAGIQNCGQHHYESLVHIERCRLLRRLGRLTDADLERARGVIGLLRKPEGRLQSLAQI